MSHNQNVDQEEIAKFEKMAATWWDPHGEFKPLHLLNPLRLNYIDEKAQGIFGKQVLDIGCGGGILSESMAKLGAHVRGIDMGVEPLEVARLHALESNIDIEYLQSTAEQHLEHHREYYDVITCMEMLEHVPDPFQLFQLALIWLSQMAMSFFLR